MNKLIKNALGPQSKHCIIVAQPYSFISCIEENLDSGAQMFNLTETVRSVLQSVLQDKNLLSPAPNVTSATVPCENSAK